MCGRVGRTAFLLIVVAPVLLVIVLVVEPFLFRGKETESPESLDPTELDIAVSALPGRTETSTARLSGPPDVVLGAVSVNEALTSELSSPSFDLSSPPTRLMALPARSGDESICSGDSRKKNRDWWLNTGCTIAGNSGTVTCFDVAIGRVELEIPGGCRVNCDVGGLGAY